MAIYFEILEELVDKKKHKNKQTLEWTEINTA